MKKSLLLFPLMMTSSLFAVQDPDFNQALQLSGDFAQFNIHNSSGYYKGNFLAKQGSMQITGNEIQLNQDKNKQLLSIVAFGNPVKLQKKIYKTQETIQASANKMTFDAKKSMITLEGNAVIKSDAGQQIKSAKISYDLISNDFEAIGKGQQRVEIIIHPNTLNQISIP
jgi:lipopolysaccharide export system protein LptA